MRKAILGTLVTIVLVGGALLVERSIRVNRGIPQQSESEADGGKVLPPDLKIKKVGSSDTVALKQFAGKVVLINFWASWCEACMAEMPSIQRLYDKLKGEGFEVVGVNVDENPEKVVPSVASRLGLKFQNYVDVDGEASKTFDVVAIPFSVVADRKQNIIWAESGERDWSSEKVVAEIKRLLKEK